MATTPINNNKLMNPLLQPKADAKGKADKIDPSALIGEGGANLGGAAQKGAMATDVSISAGAKRTAEERAKAFGIAKSTPDMREDRISELKAKIANGSYEVDSGKIADGMMREAVIEHLAETTDRSER